MKKIIDSICVGLGFFVLGIGIIGIMIPILPTTPFFLLSAALFAKGSARFHKWFTETKLYKKYIEQTVMKKEMTRKAKISVLLTISILLLLGFILSPVWYAKLVILIIAAAHFYYFLFKIKTINSGDNNSSISE